MTNWTKPNLLPVAKEAGMARVARRLLLACIFATNVESQEPSAGVPNILPALPAPRPVESPPASDTPTSDAPRKLVEEPAVAAALQMEKAYGMVAEALYPAVTCITIYKKIEDSKPDTAKEQAWRNTGKSSPYAGFEAAKTSSGFFLDKDGYILTCRHNILNDKGEPATVIDAETDDGRKTLCRVVGTEPTLNMALLKLELYPQQKLPEFSVPAIQWDPGTVFPGQIALSLGDPAGAVRTFTAGLFSATPNRQCYQNDLTSTFLQACLVAHPEAYGGPVANLKGEVVGMLTPRVTPDLTILPNPGIEFVMPIQILGTIADTLKVKGSHESPWLGFSVLELAAIYKRLARENPEAIRPPKPGEKRRMPYTGVYIDDIYDPSPAATAGVKVGDYLVAINGHKLFSVYNFQERLYLEGIGASVELELFRDGDTRKLEIKIEERPKDAITH